MVTGLGKTILPNAGVSSSGATYRFAGVEINVSRAAIRRGDQTIALRPKTFQFLLFLLERHDRVVTKEELIAGLWGDVTVTDDVLVRSIWELRRAFGDDPKDPLIFKTFPKRGYGIGVPVDKTAPPVPPLAASAPPAPASTPSSAWSPRIVVCVTSLAIIGLGGWLSVRWQPAPPSNQDPREVAWWRFDETQGVTTWDSSGRRQNGALEGGTLRVPGKFGGGLLFDGLAARVTGTDRGFLPAGDRPRTISAWIKTTAPQVEETGIFDYGAGVAPATQRFHLGLRSDGKVVVGTPAWGAVVGVRRVDDGAWHLVSGTYAGSGSSRASIYVDGKLDQSQQLHSPADTAPRASWSVGHFLNGSSSFRGTVDDVRVFNWALSEPWASALYRCSAAARDLGDYYFLPLFRQGALMGEPAPGDPSTPFANSGKDYGGVQLAKPDGVCALDGLRGASVAQDLRMSVDLLVPTDAAGRLTQAGPYFRSRRAAPGDGIVGGRSAGFWVQLNANGMVNVLRLNPVAVMAFSSAPPRFDPARFHRVEVLAQGDRLEVWLDGEEILFSQEGRNVRQVALLATPAGVGDNQGTAGVAFSAREAREELGGQRARNLKIEVLR